MEKTIATPTPTAAPNTTQFAAVDGYTPKDADEAAALENPGYRAYRQKLRDQGYLHVDNGERAAV